MSKGKRLGVSIFVVVLSILMVLCIVFTIVVNYTFSSTSRSGKLFGKYIYIMETADMMPEIEKGSAVISKSDEIQVMQKGNVILFRLETGYESVMRIRDVVHNTESTTYRVSPDADPENLTDVDKNDVIANCTKESHNLGVVISFLRTIPGILVGLLFPCLILLIVLVVKIVTSRREDEDEDVYDEYDAEFEDDEEVIESPVKPIGKRQSNNMSNPLFVPDANINQGADFERKKSSIAQNFAQKPVAQNVKKAANVQVERTPEEAVERFKAAVDEKPAAPVTRKPSLAPDNANDINDKMAAIKASLSQQKTPDANIDTSKTISISVPRESVEAAAPVRQATPQRPRPAAPAPAPKAAAAPVKKPAPKKNNNINSIDDLIKALEEEKKKL